MMAADDSSKQLEPVKLVYTSDNPDKTSFFEKAKQNPLFPIGMTGFAGLVIYNVSKIIRNRGKKQSLPLSLQLIHTRMYAQGFVIGTLSLGVIYMLGSRVYSLATHQEYHDPFHNNNDSKK